MTGNINQANPFSLNRLVAFDMAGNELKVGDTVFCKDDSEGGDTGSYWSLQAGTKYIVSAIHDEENLLNPMICVNDSENGPVFPERFLKVIKA